LSRSLVNTPSALSISFFNSIFSEVDSSRNPLRTLSTFFVVSQTY
jgi:hypothetical protein